VSRWPLQKFSDHSAYLRHERFIVGRLHNISVYAQPLAGGLVHCRHRGSDDGHGDVVQQTVISRPLQYFKPA
jgi:hypothetical protein